MSEPEVVDYLTLDDLLFVTEAVTGRGDMVADPGLLAAAALRPQATVFGEDAYVGLSAKAAALLHSLVTSHPLVDGNKRLGAAGMLLFYDLNGYDITATDDELFDLIVAVADGSLRDVAEIAARLRQWETPRS
ncbi:type II toxin-antitoxin system death-on-curing family toxin [Nocardioides sp. GCM10027113]|uniref:type II toxin-antitoxin system death-on-curing family toxin n=1 Tax=unclassified Nocardioides TaxID=2615069 RepID=UPI003608E66B